MQHQTTRAWGSINALIAQLLQARLRSGMHWHEYNRILSCLMIFSGFPAAP